MEDFFRIEKICEGERDTEDAIKTLPLFYPRTHILAEQDTEYSRPTPQNRLWLENSLTAGDVTGRGDMNFSLGVWSQTFNLLFPPSSVRL